MVRFNAVYPISNEDLNALPVKEIAPAVEVDPENWTT